MDKFKEITDYLGSDLKEFEQFLTHTVGSSHIVVDDIVDYIFESKGKRIRPILVYLTTRLFSEPTKSTHHAALLVEIIHTATLLHDDVIDEAALRRGKPTINNKWDNKTAVLSGDFLFAKAMKIATDNSEYKLFDIITPAVMSLSLGELIQMRNSKTFDIDKQQYYEVIKNKTASLLSICCEAGAFTGNATEIQILNCKKFGEVLGYIFQIKDDMLDYIGNGNTGKRIGIDIKEKKITLPLILAWDNMTMEEQKVVTDLWFLTDNNPENIKIIIDIVLKNEGILQCYNEMQLLKNQAVGILNSFDASNAKLSLLNLIDFIIERER